MHISIRFSPAQEESAAVLPFILLREHIRPALEARRRELEAMYAQRMGRPEVDPVFLTGVTLLQMMERLPDRQAITACRYDARWRLALGLPEDWAGIDPSTLVYFRRRLARHQLATLALESGLAAMRSAGYLRPHAAVRIDSTHALAQIARLSRLECVRETLRLALAFLSAFGGPAAWEPWFSRYLQRQEQELRAVSAERLNSTLDQAGQDAREVLAKAQALGGAVIQAEPVALLQRVFDEQFDSAEDGTSRPRPVTPAGSVHNPHDPEAAWSTKRSMGKDGWVGYKLQLCETAPETARAPGEPTEAVLTAALTQSAITSDHGSLSPVLEAHRRGVQAKPEEVFADAGYISVPALEAASREGFVLTGPLGAPPHSSQRFGSDAFAVDLPHRQATCPAGQPSATCARITEAKTGTTYFYFTWAKEPCLACPLNAQCLAKKKSHSFRTLQVREGHMMAQERRKLCQDPAYRLRMHRRSGIEGTHSELIRGYQLRRSRYRGRAKTDLQVQFTVAACNLRRWAVRHCWMRRQETRERI